MILKKPYAFLIKRFRLIHLILLIMITYLLTKSLRLYSFFNRYVANVYSTLSDAIPSNYITLFMFLIAIIIISFSLAMYLLMRRKEKPRTFYVVLSAYYLIYFIALIVYFVLFKNMDSASISIRDAMIWRDFTLILVIPQFAFVVMSLIRGVGFDIKKFNFSKDLKELELSESDSEEFEFVLGVDSYKYARLFRRKVREFKYYVLENKFMFTIISGLVLTIFVVVIILNFTVYNRTYGKNQKIRANNLTIEINDSYLTNLDYTGSIVEDGKYFLVVNITFKNNSGLSTVLNLSSYILEAKDRKVYPTLSRNNYFADLGAGYSKEKIENGSSASYILVYELSDSEVASKYTLRIIDEIEYKAGTINSKEKNVTLKPRKYDSISKTTEYELGKNVELYDSILGDTALQIDSFEFKNKFTYQYEACVRSNCQNKTDVVTADASRSKTLMIANGNLKMDENSVFAKNLKTNLSFFDAFVVIKYDDKFSVVTNLTPKSVTENFVLEVDSAVSKASDVDMYITVRDKRYIIDLK